MGDRRPARLLLADAAADAAATLRSLSPAARHGFLQGLPARIAGLVSILRASCSAAAASLTVPTAVPPVMDLQATPGRGQAGSEAGIAADSDAGSMARARKAPDPAQQQVPRKRGRPPVKPRPPLPRQQVDGAGASAGGPEPCAPSGVRTDSDPSPPAATSTSESPVLNDPGKWERSDAPEAAAAAAACQWVAGAAAARDLCPPGLPAPLESARAEGASLLLFEDSGDGDGGSGGMDFEFAWGDDPFWDGWAD
jgi:hypothetical protein